MTVTQASGRGVAPRRAPQGEPTRSLPRALDGIEVGHDGRPATGGSARQDVGPAFNGQDVTPLAKGDGAEQVTIVLGSFDKGFAQVLTRSPSGLRLPRLPLTCSPVDVREPYKYQFGMPRQLRQT